jgi:hypothetical protein
MQFQFNSDYPGLTAESIALGVDVGVAAARALASDPTDFPPAQPTPCARITTRIYHPSRNEVSTVQNVLVRTMTRPPQASARQQAPSSAQRDENSSMSSDDISESSSSSSSSDMEMADNNNNNMGQQQQPSVAPGQQQMALQEDEYQERAYWIQRTLRDAIYGKVLFATVLRRRYNSSNQQQQQEINADWEVTSEFCAVKEMSRQLIRKERNRLAEDPIKEVSAMQYLKRWHDSRNKQTTTPTSAASVPSFQAVMDTHVMMPLDLLSDDRNLYSIMPYCDGGELFERLDLNERFSEDEARFWMHQVLVVSRSLEDVLFRATIAARPIAPG